MENLSMDTLANLLDKLMQFANRINANERTHPFTSIPVNECTPKRSISEDHVIVYIGQHPGTNATDIAEASGITRGGISKITARLVQKGFIEVQPAPDNKKNLSYTLTDEGQAIYAQHQQLHQQVLEQLHQLSQQYTPEEIATISRFLNDIAKFI